ncbi:5'-3' exonuclease [Sulfuriflexus mobilis]|uniref:5'-3' exonuclease n=1 Tax=Sulfuriflexus mobilis TaxID=1811807 RepID=UPI0015584554|nr:5'-3' exonuclease H3TH domain-containing protein [Sulfuriflexus mobilis]
MDASIYIFRAWFSMPDSIRDNKGQPLNAVYGYVHFLCQLLEQQSPEYIAVAFDESLKSSFRNKIYPDYKANREAAPPELKRQFRLCREISDLMGLSTYASKTHEADDIIGTISKKMRRSDFRSIIVSADKDLTQLLVKGDRYWDFARDKWYLHGDIRKHFGVHSEQVVDFLALAGDSVDNIPGVPGIGKKTAISLLEKYQSLDHLYRSVETVSDSDLRGAMRIQGLLQEHREQAMLSRKLASIACNAPVSFGVRSLKRKTVDVDALGRFFSRRGFGHKLLARIEAVVKGQAVR